MALTVKHMSDTQKEQVNGYSTQHITRYIQWLDISCSLVMSLVRQVMGVGSVIQGR